MPTTPPTDQQSSPELPPSSHVRPPSVDMGKLSILILKFVISNHFSYMRRFEAHEFMIQTREEDMVQVAVEDVLNQMREIVEAEVSKQLAQLRTTTPGLAVNRIPAMPLFSCSPHDFTSIYDISAIAADTVDNPWQEEMYPAATIEEVIDVAPVVEEVVAVKEATPAAVEGVTSVKKAAVAMGVEVATAAADAVPPIRQHSTPPAAKPSRPRADDQKLPSQNSRGILHGPFKSNEDPPTIVGAVVTGIAIVSAILVTIRVLSGTVATNPGLVLICVGLAFLTSLLTTAQVVNYMIPEKRL